jgi:hypothetical protein
MRIIDTGKGIALKIYPNFSTLPASGSFLSRNIRVQALVFTCVRNMDLLGFHGVKVN